MRGAAGSRRAPGVPTRWRSQAAMTCAIRSGPSPIQTSVSHGCRRPPRSPVSSSDRTCAPGMSSRYRRPAPPPRGRTAARSRRRGHCAISCVTPELSSASRQSQRGRAAARMSALGSRRRARRTSDRAGEIEGEEPGAAADCRGAAARARAPAASKFAVRRRVRRRRGRRHRGSGAVSASNVARRLPVRRLTGMTFRRAPASSRAGEVSAAGRQYTPAGNGRGSRPWATWWSSARSGATRARARSSTGSPSAPT